MSVRLGPFCSLYLLGDDRTRFILSKRYKLALHPQQGPEVEVIIDFEQHFQQWTWTHLHQISWSKERKTEATFSVLISLLVAICERKCVLRLVFLYTHPVIHTSGSAHRIPGSGAGLLHRTDLHKHDHLATSPTLSRSTRCHHQYEEPQGGMKSSLPGADAP